MSFIKKYLLLTYFALAFAISWGGILLVVGSVVMLTLLLAPEAYIAIGLAFALLILVALGTMVAARSSAQDGATRRLFTPTQ